MAFLPLTKQEMDEYGWEKPDFIYVTGDAYIDHPSFGPAIITRILERFGFKCAIISQPNVGHIYDFTLFGEPRLGFLVSSGNIDSMVSHYTVGKKRRKKDYYTPNGEIGKRPDRAVIRYCNVIREIYNDTAIIIGGIEASLRRLSHYDYWDDHVRKSILIDSKADLLLYGMGEKTIVELAEALDSGLSIKDVIYIRNSVWKTNDDSILPKNAVILPEYNIVSRDKNAYVDSFNLQYNNTDAFNGKPLIEKYDDIYIVQNIPQLPLSKDEIDQVYNLPFMRDVHPLIEKRGHVSAIDEVKYSITINRGCFGGCNFCALSFHQGKIVQSRSKESVINEAILLSNDKDFKGYIHDIGGPTANFYEPACEKQMKAGTCKNKECIGFKPCNNLQVSHDAYLDILSSVSKLPRIKKVFIRSGLRYDYILYDKDKTFLQEVIKNYISGQLRVAPEHIDDEVLEKMGKPSRSLYDEFAKEFYSLNKKFNKNQFLVPYLISSHPGSTLEKAIALAEYLKENSINVDQVQDFYPTPSTASTCMYYTGIDPFTNTKVYVPKNPHEKALQRALIQFKDPKNYDLVKEALLKCNKNDLIGFSSKCLIKPNRSL